ncbi:MAG: transposase [Bryobacteraceae bacterium]|nr:transposase [Bryobacteraceae bacterium]
MPKPPAHLTGAPPRKRDWMVRQCYHVYQRGSRRQQVFSTHAQLTGYLDRLDRLARRYRVRVHAYCLMSNHVHFVLEPLTKWGISHLMQHLQSHYARGVHQELGVTGHLWRNHFHAKHIKTARQYRATLLYVEQNPTAAGIARRAHVYCYSSAPAHAANDPLHSRVRLYMTRWRKEFPTYLDWPATLRSPHEAEFRADFAEVERVLGSDRVRPYDPEALPETELGLESAAASAPGFTNSS